MFGNPEYGPFERTPGHPLEEGPTDRSRQLSSGLRGRRLAQWELSSAGPRKEETPAAPCSPVPAGHAGRRPVSEKSKRLWTPPGPRARCSPDDMMQKRRLPSAASSPCTIRTGLAPDRTVCCSRTSVQRSLPRIAQRGRPLPRPRSTGPCQSRCVSSHSAAVTFGSAAWSIPRDFNSGVPGAVRLDIAHGWRAHGSSRSYSATRTRSSHTDMSPSLHAASRTA